MALRQSRTIVPTPFQANRNGTHGFQGNKLLQIGFSLARGRAVCEVLGLDAVDEESRNVPFRQRESPDSFLFRIGPNPTPVVRGAPPLRKMPKRTQEVICNQQTGAKMDRKRTQTKPNEAKLGPNKSFRIEKGCGAPLRSALFMARLGRRATLALLVVAACQLLCPQVSVAGAQATAPASSQKLFVAGENALKRGDLDAAETDFRRLLALNGNDAGAYANLGVVEMRQKRWPQALEMLHKAQALAPEVPGIRLNVGLVYYRQYEFAAAIPALESVVRDQPDSLQARYLLGLCYFFTDRDAEGARTLESIWSQESGEMNYLYVLGVAAEQAKLTDLQNRALARLAEVGQDSAELHLLMGKAELNRLEYDKATSELERAAEIDPRLPFVHYYTGVAYRKRHEFERAKAEFLKDAAIEPDVAFNFNELGAVSTELQQPQEAARYFEQALKLDPHLATSYYGLAKADQQQGKNLEALAALDRAGAIDPESASVHYLRGQVLQRLGRRPEAQAEFDRAAALQKAVRDRLEQAISGAKPPQPDLAQESQ